MPLASALDASFSRLWSDLPGFTRLTFGVVQESGTENPRMLLLRECGTGQGLLRE